MKPTFTGLIYILLAIAPVHAETVSPLQARGYTVMPQPQVVKLGPWDFEFGPDWKIEAQGAGPNDVAIETLKDELDRRIKVFGGNYYGIAPTINLHGVEFRAVLPNSAPAPVE